MHSELEKVLKCLGLQQPPKVAEQANDDGSIATLSPIKTLHDEASHKNPTFVDDSAKLPCKNQDDQEADSPHGSRSSEYELLTVLPQLLTK